MLLFLFAGVYFFKLQHLNTTIRVLNIAFIFITTVVTNLIFYYLSILKPLRRITAETEFLGKGDLEHLLDVSHLSGELSPLAKNLNKMAQTFKNDSEALKTRINELTTIYKLNSEIAITLNINGVMDTAKRVLKSIIDFSKILIYIKNAKSNNYNLASGINLSINDPLELEKDNELVQLAFTLNDAVVLNQFPEMLRQDSKNENWEILSPMVVNQEPVGIIKIEIDEGKTVDEDIVRLIRTLTTQIAIGVQNSMLYSDLEQKVADQTLELRKSYEIIFSQKEELQKIIQSIADPLVVTDETNRIEMVNDAFIRIFALSKNKEYLNQSITELLNIQCIKEFFYENTDSNESIFKKEITIQEGEIPGLFSEEKNFLVTSALMVRENRKLRYVTIFRDITEEKKLDKMKTDFVSTVSHELRTPLTSIKAFAKILLADTMLIPKDRDEFLTIIDSEADRLTRLINDILDHAKLEAGKLDFDFKPLDIVDMVKNQIRNLYSIIQNAGINISLKKQNVPPVIADRDRITQVITNLLSNATKFTRKNGNVDITVKNITLNKLLHQQISPEVIKRRYPLIDETHNYVEVSIADNGIGISKENQIKIFEKFKQIGDTLTDKPKGTGLGLPICRQIVESHQGAIWVESEYGKGSTFYFTLPVYMKKNRHLSFSKGKDEPKRILVVDEDKEYVDELIPLLSKYFIYEAKNTDIAAKLLEFNTKIDLIIIDPKNMDAEVLLNKINEKQMTVPFIINTEGETEELPYLKQRVRKTRPDNSLLLKKINHLFETEKLKVLIIMNNDILSYQISVYLTQNNFDIYLARTIRDGLRKCYGVNPDTVVVSDMLTDMNLSEFFYELSKHEITHDIFSILIHEQEDKIAEDVSHYGVKTVNKENAADSAVAYIIEHFQEIKEVVI